MITLTPAYGRDYKSKAECIKDLESGKDFILNDFTSRWNGKPCSVRDFRGQQITVRFNKLTKVFMYTCKEL